MPIRPLDYITPTAMLVVSRARVKRAVEQVADADEARRERWIEDLVAYEPPRRNGLRNNFIFWVGTLGAAMLADFAGVRPWVGFVAALLGFLCIARVLAVRTLLWRLERLRAGEPARADRSPG